jgi:hypothetical protein
MRQLMKSFLWVGLLVFGLQTSWAFSLLGPSAAYLGAPSTLADSWQTELIGFNPIPAYIGAPPYIGADPLAIGPKNIGEGYRRNTPVIYYGFDRNFSKYFGVNGEQAVDQAFGILNALTNVDSYSSDLVEFPLQSQSQNYNLMSVELRDVKSTTLAIMMEQMGLTDAIRYTWVLHNRFAIPGGRPCPLDMDYLVTMRNYPIGASPLNQLQYSDYVNGELYTYTIAEICESSPAQPPVADAVEHAADDLVYTQPVASGGSVAEGALMNGFFYTGLTRDDVGGLRSLYSSNNFNMESMAAGSTLLSGSSGSTYTNLGDEFQLTTYNLTAFILAAATNNPAALQALYPGLVISSVRTNYNGTFTYTFANVVTNTLFTNTLVQYQIITAIIGSGGVGWPLQYYGTAANPLLRTNTVSVMTNIVSGDFFLIPTNFCGLDILQVLATNVTAITNTLGTVTNTTVAATNYITTSIVIVSTNYALLVAPCEFLNGTTATTPTNGDYAGIERIQFVRVPDENIDPLTGNFIRPITITNTMMVKPPDSIQATVQTFQRVLTRPDILFSAQDLLPGPGVVNDIVAPYTRSVTFNQTYILPGLAGPGTIDPPSTIIFNKVGPVLENQSPSFLTEESAGLDGFIWGSFDGTTNDPTVYPNGTSIANLAAEALIQISPPPPALPDGTNGVAYNGTNVTLSATGGQSPYTWSLTADSALPPNLTLSSGGVISGTPAATSGTYDVVIQMTDTAPPNRPSYTVDTTYSITIH